MIKKLLYIMLRYMKLFFLATFYGFRQWGLQMLCWILILWLMSITELDDSGAFLSLIEGTLYGFLFFTIPYHWSAAFIPKERMFTRFVVPYIFCAGLLYLSLFIVQKEAPLLMWVGLATPFICLLFFLLEDYLKKLLTPHPKVFKGIKIACNAITSLPLFVVTVIVIASIWGEVSRKHRFDDTKTLTRITEVEFPKFKVIEYEKGRTSFHGDYSDKLVLEFKEMPSEEFYAEIAESANWNIKNDSTYYYSRVWGNGLPAPPGEDDEEDMSLNIQIKRGDKRFYVSYGAW